MAMTQRNKFRNDFPNFCAFQQESTLLVMDNIFHDISWMNSYLLLFIDLKLNQWSAYSHKEDFLQKLMELFLTFPLLLLHNLYKDHGFIMKHFGNSETLKTVMMASV